MTEKELAIGIDLGTCYSAVSIFRNGSVDVIPNDQGNRTLPSYVAFCDNGERLVGEAAKNQAAINAKKTIFDAKRLIGRKFSDSSVQSDLKYWPFEVVPDTNDKPQIKIDDKLFYPEQISAMVLAKLKKEAETFLGKPVKKAVITVPAYFNDSQRQSTKDAGAIAGLEVLRIINEPTAAAMAYGLQDAKQHKNEQNVMIVDLGGGTYDVSLLTIDNGVFEVKAVGGNTRLGGEDLDNALVKYCCEDFKRKHKKDLSTNDRALRRLRTACEKAKRTLSSSTMATIDVDSLFEGIDLNMSISRAKFEDLCNSFFVQCLEPIEKVLKDANMSKSKIDEVVLVGGSTRIPKIQQLVSNFFGGKTLNKSVNPDEVVSMGAAIQAAILTGNTTEETKDMLVIDVTPLSLGIETAGGVMTNIIDRNSSIPCTKSNVFSTYSDNQSAVTIQVYEGERKFTKDNHRLGTFDLTGIPPAPRGVPQIEVSFNLDANGILNVTATDKSTKNKKNIVITNNQGRLSKDEVESMIKEASKFAEEDAARAKTVEARNSLDGYIYHVKNSVEDEKIASKLSTQDKTTLVNMVEDALGWVQSNQNASEEEFTEKRKNLEKIVTPIMSKLYTNQEQSTESGPKVEELD